MKRERINEFRIGFREKQRKFTNLIKRNRTVKGLHLFRNYSAFIVVVSSAILVSATNLAAGRESSGFLFGYFGTNEDYENPLKNMPFVKSSEKNNLALSPFLESKQIIDPKLVALESEDDEDSMLIQRQALVAKNSPIRKDPEEDGGVIVYEVKSGDTVGAIAQKYGINVNTILWANELDNINSIMPGDKIFILPVSGFEYKVKKGDNIDAIAKEYKTTKDKIISFNDLPANGELEEGQMITIPDGQKEIPQTVQPQSNLRVTQRQYESFSVGKKLEGKAGTGHNFPYGYCTWYVAQKRYVPWSGNAGTWLYHAKAMGYATGRKPKVGSIMVSSESWWGHVALVEKVSGNTITISEMNYKGWAKKSYRTLDARSRVVKGFIY